MKTRIELWGNDLAIRIPDEFAVNLHIEENVAIDLDIRRGDLIIRRLSHKRYTIEELLRHITPDQLHHETDWGQLAGREHID
jgi:antitoxin MazE